MMQIVATVLAINVYYHGNHFSPTLIALKGGHIQGSLLQVVVLASLAQLLGLVELARFARSIQTEMKSAIPL